MNLVSMHCLVRGKVQGVSYRQSTLAQANHLLITGWVRNLPTGEVELIATGPRENLDALYQWLWQGPKHAKVNEVLRTDLEYQEFSTFEIKY